LHKYSTAIYFCIHVCFCFNISPENPGINKVLISISAAKQDRPKRATTDYSKISSAIFVQKYDWFIFNFNLFCVPICIVYFPVYSVLNIVNYSDNGVLFKIIPSFFCPKRATTDYSKINIAALVRSMTLVKHNGLVYILFSRQLAFFLHHKMYPSFIIFLQCGLKVDEL
jgi:hypothetical protein